jgi:hypothetical protein
MKNNVINNHNVRRTTPMLTITWDVLEAIIKTIGSLKAETGGAIAGEGYEKEITHYYFDESSRSSAWTYSPDHKGLNQLFKTEWNPKGVRLRGFVHSHPGRMGRPSYGDEVYADHILQAVEDMDLLWLPIVNTIPDTGAFKLIPWAAYRNKEGVEVVRGKIQVVQGAAQWPVELCGEDVSKSISFGVSLGEIIFGRAQQKTSTEVATGIRHDEDQSRTTIEISQGPPVQATALDLNDTQANDVVEIKNTFERVRDAYDLNLMQKSRVIAVGAGGAASWLEELARTGLGQFVLIDPDTVSETNLATQQTYRHDIGRAKVDCIADRIRDINPSAIVRALNKSLDDLTDSEMKVFATEPIDGRMSRMTVICGLTDSFEAQARVNRLALHFGLPSLCAQVYKEGRGAEVTFTFPGVTPACHRCILSSRYRYFLEQGNKNIVTSHGTPIFATTRLNAIKGFVILALFHHGSTHPRWGSMLSRIGKRNLIQIRMDPDFAETMGITVFNRVFQNADRERLFFDEVVWLPQNQECPEIGGHPKCPDCGGTGDLRDAIGKFEDTKLKSQATNKKTNEIQKTNICVSCVTTTHECDRRIR